MNHQAGVVTAFVKEVEAERGRVRVDYLGMSESLISPWASIAAPLSGARRGMQFMPEVDDEVLVAFADGDFDHPYVIGFLWNGEQVAPETDPDNRVIVTPGGHQLRFEDKAGLKRIVLQSAAKRRITLDDGGSGKIEIKSGSHTILMDDSGKVEVTTGGGQKIEMVDAPPSIALSDATGASIKMGPTGIEITSPSLVSIKAPMLKVDAAMATFSGAVMVTGPVTTSSVVSPLYTPGVGNLL